MYNVYNQDISNPQYLILDHEQNLTNSTLYKYKQSLYRGGANVKKYINSMRSQKYTFKNILFYTFLYLNDQLFDLRCRARAGLETLRVILGTTS